jgi:PPM family protein phosphatase
MSALTPALQIAMLSRIGGRERNEDACGYWDQGGAACLVLSDGAGGHGGGDIAARVAVQAVLARFAEDPQATPEAVDDLLAYANAAVRGSQIDNPALADMRATLVTLVIDPQQSHAVWGHVGDSRLYCFRQGEVLAQTRDHSLFESMIAAGFALDSNRRNNPERNVLTASLGAEDSFMPEVNGHIFAVQSGDVFLLCTDGFWDYVTEAQMEGSLQRASSPQQWLDQMGEQVARLGRAGQDNYSALAVWFGSPDFTTQLVMPSGSIEK